MVLTIARHFPIACIGKPVAIIHGHDSPTRMTNDPLRVARGVAMLVRKYQKDIVLYHGKFYLALWWLRVARAYLFAETHRGASSFPGRAASYLPLGALHLPLRSLARVYRLIVRTMYRFLDLFLRRQFDYIYF
jgi:hypothetical protein